jgi:hypothetical protein
MIDTSVNRIPSAPGSVGAGLDEAFGAGFDLV